MIEPEGQGQGDQHVGRIRSPYEQIKFVFEIACIHCWFDPYRSSCFYRLRRSRCSGSSDARRSAVMQADRPDAILRSAARCLPGPDAAPPGRNWTRGSLDRQQGRPWRRGGRHRGVRSVDWPPPASAARRAASTEGMRDRSSPAMPRRWLDARLVVRSARQIPGNRTMCSGPAPASRNSRTTRPSATRTCPARFPFS
jgi:hypothetical protein